MGVIVNQAVRCSILPAAWYLEAAKELDHAAIRGGGVLKIDPAYQSSEAFRSAAIGLYTALSNTIARQIILYNAGALDWALSDEIAPWVKAYEEDHLARFGWVHRVVNEMLGLRSSNGFSNLGEEEFDRVFRVIAETQYDA